MIQKEISTPGLQEQTLANCLIKLMEEALGDVFCISEVLLFEIFG